MTWLTKFFRKEEQRRPEPDPGAARAQSELLASERSVHRSKIEGEEARELTERLRAIRKRNHLAASLRLRLQEGLRD